MERYDFWSVHGRFDEDKCVMSGEEIYENHLGWALKEVEEMRERYGLKTGGIAGRTEALRSDVFGVEDDDYYHYKYLVEHSRKYFAEATQKIVLDLMNRYNIAFEKCNEETCVIYGLPAFIKSHEGQRTLYFFIDYKIKNRRINGEYLSQYYNVKKIVPIVIVDDSKIIEAKSRGVNLADDLSDKTVSIYQFFVENFDQEEFLRYMSYAKVYSEKAKKYIGISLVRTLTPNALMNYKAVLKYELKHFDYRDHLPKSITEEDVRSIQDQFLGDNFYECLLGNGDYATSFITAEWLFDSMKASKNIDYTAIAMNYFKAVEQLLYKYIVVIHKNQKRTIAAYITPKGNKDPFVELNDDNINKGIINTTLNTLIGFLRWHNNDDLLRHDLSIESRDSIKDYLGNIKELRNGYFHKDNMTEWKNVEESRNLAFVTCFLILGAFITTDNEKSQLQIPQGGKHNGFYQLCEYLSNQELLKNEEFYNIHFEDKDTESLVLLPDPYKKYDDFGHVIYSGLYFHGEHGKVCYTEESLSDDCVVYKTKLISTEKAGGKPVWNTTKIYDHGVFCGEDLPKPLF